MELADSITSAVANADFISLNIPYIKGTPDKGGTHGIINSDIISLFKPNAVLLNFARGELVDSEALKEFLDRGNGRYVSDFPDDVIWNHPNAIILPHLGASTDEAEEAAVSCDKGLCISVMIGETKKLTLIRTLLNLNPFII
jgi:D-3-phosphoglycerate dehydrogenase